MTLISDLPYFSITILLDLICWPPTCIKTKIFKSFPIIFACRASRRYHAQAQCAALNIRSTVILATTIASNIYDQSATIIGHGSSMCLNTRRRHRLVHSRVIPATWIPGQSSSCRGPNFCVQALQLLISASKYVGLCTGRQATRRDQQTEVTIKHWMRKCNARAGRFYICTQQVAKSNMQNSWMLDIELWIVTKSE